ncbi:MAG: cell division protein FtsZ [Paludibacter sp.]|nr:cell division protein FtsZ [Paludibacter sp.]
MDELTITPPPVVSETISPSIIKVIGVGGGGGNAVNHMYRQGITDVTFVICNTDIQDLAKSPIPYKIQLGPQLTSGLGAGADPETGRMAAEESIESIKKMLGDNTKMVFITAGMGGGTGTGASPIIARTAHEMKILTIAIVTIPFKFEGAPKIRAALEGVRTLNKYVDAILVINNEKLLKLYPNMKLSEAFRYADDVLSNAAKSIAEIITITGHINLDFADVKRILENGQVAVMNTGASEGELRIEKAIHNALYSPLLDNDISSSKKILLNFYCSESDENQISIEEVEQINKFMEQMSENIDVVWGITYDNSLEKAVKVTLIATGFDISAIPGMKDLIAKTPELPIVEPPQPQQPIVSQAENQAASNVIAEEPPKKNTDAIIEEIYGGKKTEPEQTTQTNDDDIPSVNIEDLLKELNNEEKLSYIENIPAWKRR